MKLSDAQSKVVNAPVGKAMQVLASAGSGKTRVLTERVRYILKNTTKDGAIALTFTNKAAEEMKTRLSDVDGLEERCWIGTVHSIAQRILNQYGNTIGLPSDLQIFEYEESRKAVFLESLRASNYNIDEFLGVDQSDRSPDKSRNKVIKNYLDQFSTIKRELLSEEEIKEKFSYDDDFWAVFQEYQQALLDSGGIDFDDILVYAHRILLEQPWCADIYRAKYKHILVDEAQDLNKAQYEFVRALCGEKIKSVLMVGDPNQMIYGFNSSSHDFLCIHFIKDFSAMKYELKENYRSSRAVIRVSNKLRPGSQVETEFALAGICEFKDFKNEKEEAEWVVKKIRESISLGNHDEIEGPISLEKMVVIARNRFVFLTLEEEFKKEQISYSLKKSERLAERESLFGRILDLGIRVRLNPKDWVDGRKLLSLFKAKEPSSWGSADILKDLPEIAKKSKVPLAGLQSELLQELANLNLEDPNIPKLHSDFSKKIKELSTTESADVQNELERSLSELQEVRSCWTNFKKKGLGDSLSAFRNAMALGQLSEDQTSGGVLLSTVHTMKGLEKDIVFLIGMCEGVFPDYRATTKKDLEEEKNNAFVAVTRSRRWLYIAYPQSRKMPWGDEKAQVRSRFMDSMRK